MKRLLHGLPCLATTVLFATGCGVDTAPEGLRATPPGDGATVVFEPTARPLPNIPAPNASGVRTVDLRAWPTTRPRPCARRRRAIRTSAGRRSSTPTGTARGRTASTPRPRPRPCASRAWPADAPVIGATLAYINPVGQHVWTFTEPCKSFDDAVYYDHMIGRLFASGGKDPYFLSHPQSHWCMANESCPFFH